MLFLGLTIILGVLFFLNCVTLGKKISNNEETAIFTVIGIILLALFLFFLLSIIGIDSN